MSAALAESAIRLLTLVFIVGLPELTLLLIERIAYSREHMSFILPSDEFKIETMTGGCKAVLERLRLKDDRKSGHFRS